MRKIACAALLTMFVPPLLVLAGLALITMAQYRGVCDGWPGYSISCSLGEYLVFSFATAEWDLRHLFIVTLAIQWIGCVCLAAWSYWRITSAGRKTQITREVAQ
jgi:hypothetical protein